MLSKAKFGFFFLTIEWPRNSTVAHPYDVKVLYASWSSNLITCFCSCTLPYTLVTRLSQWISQRKGDDLSPLIYLFIICLVPLFFFSSCALKWQKEWNSNKYSWCTFQAFSKIAMRVRFSCRHLPINSTISVSCPTELELSLLTIHPIVLSSFVDLCVL